LITVPTSSTTQGQWIDHRPDIVDDDIGDELDSAGLRVDLDLADVTAVRVSGLLRRPGRMLDQPRLHPGRQAGGLERGARHRFQRQRPVSAGDRELAVGKFDIGDRGLQNMRGEPPALVDDLVGRERQRPAAGDH
jgi:hypothetical protein